MMKDYCRMWDDDINSTTYIIRDESIQQIPMTIDTAIRNIINELNNTSEKEEKKEKARPEDPIEKVYFNPGKGSTTIVWKDKEKTTVKCQGGEPFDPEKGLALCFMKKFFDNRGCYYEFIKKWIKEGEFFKKKDKTL